MAGISPHHPHSSETASNSGFTLIELSIVLVIIGLIVGGVLVGQDLIRAAEVRAQVSQIEKYNTAVNTFRVKFNALPGDMALVTANQFGFITDASCDGSTHGERDSDGMIEGGTTAVSYKQASYETGMFWQDLSSNAGGNLIDGSFSGIVCGALGATVPGTGVGNYIPPAKLGKGMYVYVYTYLKYNWYGLSGVGGISTSGAFLPYSAPLTVIQAYNIDKKMDDALPTTGNVQALYLTGGPSNSVNNPLSGNPVDPTDCTDGSVTPNLYAISVNNGTGSNCAISFRFQ